MTEKRSVGRKGVLGISTAAAAVFLACIPVSVPNAESGQATTKPRFDASAAYGYLVRQCDFGPRIPGTPPHLRCRDFLVETLKKHGGRVSTQAFQMKYGTPVIRVEAYNIIARFQPEKKPRVLLCAHWDTRPWADKDPNPANRNTPIMGANDGASGVAVLLEFARILKAHPPAIGVDIVFFDGEDAGQEGRQEDWIQGSTYYAQTLDYGDRPQMAILLDMIGDSDLNLPKEEYSWRLARTLTDKIWETAAELKLKAFIPEVRYGILDDHLPLLRAGIPTVDLIDFDYPHWHTLADTPDKCSPASLDQIGRLLIHLVYHFEEIF